jgi:two-component system LytT family sensor kinase
MHRSHARYLIEFIIHALFWIGVYYALKALTSASYSMVNYTDGNTQRMDVRILFTYSWVVLGSLMLLFYSNTFWLFKRVIRYKSDLARVAVIAGWFMLIFVMNYVLINTVIGPSGSGPSGSNHHPLRMSFLLARSDTVLVRTHPMTAFPGPPPPFGQSPADNWLHMQLIIALVFLSVLAIAAANFFIKEWIRNDLRRSQAEAQQLSTEIRLLRSQINPHFLFNTLNNLFSMAQRRGHEELADGVSKLSGMMRYMIYESNTDTVPLQREIAYLEDCIALNKLRYADSEVAVTFRHPAPAVAGGISIAPMLFVPFLENAFKHGVSIGSHSGITMDISVGQKKLIFTCENTDHSGVKKLETEKGGIGLENVRRRLELVYPGRHELLAGSSGGKYTINLQIELA